MKIFKAPLFFLIAVLLLSTGIRQSEGKNRFAAGVILGEPSGISLKFGRFPVLAFGWSVYNHMHLNVDYWIINQNIERPFAWYLGLGGKFWFNNHRFPSDSADFAAGFRVPIGLQLFLTEDWELFGEIAPGLMLFPGTGFWWDAGIGLRYHF